MKRIILAALFVPALIIIIKYLPWYNHLVLNILTTSFAFIGGIEMAALLAHRGVKISPWIAGITAALPPCLVYLNLTIGFPSWIIPAVLITAAALVLSREGLTRDPEAVDLSLSRFTGTLSLFVYPGLFMAFLASISFLHYPSQAMMTFLAMVFCNDSGAYFVGTKLGRNNKGIFPVSPNKSVAGLFGGWGGSILAGIVCAWVFPELIQEKWGALIVLSTGVSILAVIGDLVESSFKRSAGVKDSGTLLHGRGGALDSLDSLMFAAPFFYFIIKALF
jgi:phosphatidate cytidylyltransferase